MNKTKHQETSLQREFRDQKLYVETLKCGRKRPLQEQKEDTANARFQDARDKTKSKMKVRVQGKKEKRLKKKKILPGIAPPGKSTTQKVICKL